MILMRGKCAILLHFVWSDNLTKPNIFSGINLDEFGC